MKMMFTTEVPAEFSILSCIGQQLLATLCPLICAAIFGVDQLALVVACGSAFLFAFMFHTAIPRSAEVGRWVWVLPSGFFAWMFVRDVIKFGLFYAFGECFNPFQRGEDALAFLLATCPTCAAVVYSISMSLLSARAARRS